MSEPREFLLLRTEDSISIIRRADILMVSSKEFGRGTWQVIVATAREDYTVNFYDEQESTKYMEKLAEELR